MPVPCGPRRKAVAHHVRLRAGIIVGLVGLVACSAARSTDEHSASSLEAMSSENGLSLNGFSLNGLSLNGLSLNGLATAHFSQWFNVAPTTYATTMAYVVKCAYAAGTSLGWTNPV